MAEKAATRQSLQLELPQLVEALETQQDDGETWYRLGQVCFGLGRLSDADLAMRVACDRLPDRFGPQLLRAHILHKTGRPELALTQLARAQAVADTNDEVVEAMRLMRQVHLALGNFEMSEKLLKADLELFPGRSAAIVGIALLKLRRGEYQEGWLDYEARPRSPTLDSIRFSPATPPQWQGESLDGKSILLLHEQGIGDTIQFLRYVPELKNRWRCNVVATCQTGLFDLFSRYSPVDQWLVPGSSGIKFDVQCSLLDLARYLGPEPVGQSGAYLSADPKLFTYWKERLSAYEGIRVGLVWQGNQANPSDSRRSFPFEDLSPLWRLTGVTFFSLQKGDDEIPLMDPSVLGVVDLSPIDEDSGSLMDTAAILTNLDLVVSCDTAIAHLAGALSVPTFLALCKGCDWRWGTKGEQNAWYPSVRLFRQSRAFWWQDVFLRIGDAIATMPGVDYRPPEEYRTQGRAGGTCVRYRYGRVVIHDEETAEMEGRSILSTGDFAEAELRLLRQILRKGDTVVLVGENSIGSHAIALARTVGEYGCVRIIPSEAANVSRLCENLKMNELGNVEVITANGHGIDTSFGKGGDNLTLKIRNAAASVEKENPVPSLIRLTDSADLSQTLEQFADEIVTHRPILYLRAERPDMDSERNLRNAGYKMYRKTHRHFRVSNYMFSPVSSEERFTNVLCIPRDTDTNVVGMDAM